jgi:signal transduction histidine kinase/ActR/RegA family two-component response regulator
MFEVMHAVEKISVERLMLLGFGMTLAILLLAGGIAWNNAMQPVAAFIWGAIVLLLTFQTLLYVRIRQVMRRRLAAEQALREAQQPLLKAGALQDAIFNSPNFSTIATDDQGVIQIFNIGAERMLGYSAADVVNKLTPAGISDAQEIVARASALSLELNCPIAPGFEALVFKASRGIEDIYELTYVRNDGSRFPAVVSVTALRDAQEKVIGYLLIGTDNTARKQVEAKQALLDQRFREQQQVLQANNTELEHARAAAEKANLAKSDFLSSMSHELRTPLNAVLGFAQLMASDTVAPSASQKQSIDQILQAGWYLLRLINEILDLAMIESGKVTMSQEAMSLADVLTDCQAMIEPQAHKRGIRMTFPRFDNLFYVHADRTRVKQVMINLLANAIKYNRDGGSVVVECAMSGESRVRVSVRDTGAGLAPEQVAQLFQPFNRVGQEAGGEEGTGIGLVVTKQLVELMGGTIGVVSNVGVGTNFWVEWKASSAPELALGSLIEIAPEEIDAIGAQTSLPQRTLLYVEDNPANLILVEQLIARRSDLKLLTATDGHLGIELARTYQPDLILMDINLPGISGYTALEILRRDPATSHIPVMALSANAVPRDIEKGLEAGFFRYLTKPIKVTEFMDALDVALRFAAEHGSTAGSAKDIIA